MEYFHVDQYEHGYSSLSLLEVGKPHCLQKNGIHKNKPLMSTETFTQVHNCSDHCDHNQVMYQVVPLQGFCVPERACQQSLIIIMLCSCKPACVGNEEYRIVAQSLLYQLMHVQSSTGQSFILQGYCICSAQAQCPNQTRKNLASSSCSTIKQ